jgi:hypothetical protein
MNEHRKIRAIAIKSSAGWPVVGRVFFVAANRDNLETFHLSFPESAIKL